MMFIMIEVRIPIIKQDGEITFYVEPNETYTYDFQSVITLRSSSNKRLRNINIKSYLPPNDLHQELRSLKSNLPVNIKYDEQGNRILIAQVDVVPPKRQEEISLCGKLILKPISMIEDLKEIPIIEEQEYTGRLQDHTRREIMDLIKKLGINKDTNPLDIIIKVLKYIKAEIRYFKAPYRLGGMFALKQRKGSCDEISDLTIAFLRAIGINARSIIGYYIPRGLHEWVEVKSQRGWVPIDPTFGIFGGIGSRWLKILAEPKPSTKIIKIRAEGRGIATIHMFIENHTILKNEIRILGKR